MECGICKGLFDSVRARFLSLRKNFMLSMLHEVTPRNECLRS